MPIAPAASSGCSASSSAAFCPAGASPTGPTPIARPAPGVSASTPAPSDTSRPPRASSLPPSTPPCAACPAGSPSPTCFISGSSTSRGISRCTPITTPCPPRSSAGTSRCARATTASSSTRGRARSPCMSAKSKRSAGISSDPSIGPRAARAGRGRIASPSPRRKTCAACCPRSTPTSAPSSAAASSRPPWPCASSCAWPASIRGSLCSPPSRPRPTTASTISRASSAWSCAASPPPTSSCPCRPTPCQESPTMSRPMDELQQLLKNLHLSRMAQGLPEELQRAEKEGLAYTELLLRLVRAQWHHRQETALEWRIRQARLPERWALETFPFKDQPGVNKRQIMSLAELDFIPTATNIVFIGPTGVGKSGLASGLLLKALQNGYRALFIKAQDLFDDLYASLADRSSRKLIDRLARVPLLCIDEMGYLTLRPEQSNIFFKLMEERYRRRASIITTNLDYDDWLNFLGNKHMMPMLAPVAAATSIYRKGRKFIFSMQPPGEGWLEGLIDLAAKKESQDR